VDLNLKGFSRRSIQLTLFDMNNDELKHILIAYKSTNIGLQEAHDEILSLFNIISPDDPTQIDEGKYKELMRALYPKDNSKYFKR
jgi:hypothetical protein